MLDLSAELPDLEAKDVVEEWQNRFALSSEYRFQMSEDEDFHLGNQLTPSQRDYLQNLGQSDQPNNKIKPAVEQVLANVAASSPEWMVKPEGSMDNNFSFVINRLLDKIWMDSKADMSLRANAKDFIIKGLTFQYCFPDWNADKGIGALRITDLPPESMSIDQNSIRPDFSDASSQTYSDLDTKTNMRIEFPQYIDEIDKAQTEQQQNENRTGYSSRDSIYVRGVVQDKTQDVVRKYVRWAKITVPYAKITNTLTGAWMFLTDEQYDDAIENPDFTQMIDQGLIFEEVVYRKHIRETFVIGNELAYDNILPINEYPVKPACNDHSRHPMPSGDVRQAKGPQRKLNRTEALIIAHASATANIKYAFEEGAIDDNEVNKLSLPGAVPIKFNPGGLREGKFHEFQVHQVNSELYLEKGRYERDIETIFGAYKFQQGDPGGAPGTVGEAQIIDEASARKQNWKIQPLYDMMTGIARVALQWMPFVYPEQRVLRLVNEIGSEQEVVLNQVVTDYSGAVQKIYDMESIDADVRAISGSARAKSPLANLQKNLTLLNAGIFDRTQVILGLEENIDKPKLMSRLSEIPQLQSALKQSQDKIKELEGDIDTRERELFHTKMDLKVSDSSKKVDALITDLKRVIDTEKARQKDKTALINSKDGATA